MQIRTRNTDGTVIVDVIDASDGAIAGSYQVPMNDQLVVTATTAHSPADIEVGAIEPIPTETTDAPPATEGAEPPAAGGDEGSAAPADGEGAGAPAEGAEGTDTAGGTPPAEGADTGGAAPAGEEAAEGAGAPTTSEASEKPLYTLAGEVPEGFAPSGLDTPDGATLYHYAGDSAGAAHTADVGIEGLDLYAEADDNSQPVVAAGGPEQAAA
jgi:hypothetical protein